MISNILKVLYFLFIIFSIFSITADIFSAMTIYSCFRKLSPNEQKIFPFLKEITNAFGYPHS